MLYINILGLGEFALMLMKNGFYFLMRSASEVCDCCSLVSEMCHYFKLIMICYLISVIKTNTLVYKGVRTFGNPQLIL